MAGPASMNRRRMQHIEEFHALLAKLEKGLGGKRLLGECTGKMDWPEAGVYFFFEDGEMRGADRNAPRVVRVGTHRVSRNSKATLWGRLRAHRGTMSGGGNHRGSIFRLHVGTALRATGGGDLKIPTWSEGSSAPKEVREKERPLEEEVSKHLRRMSLLWLAVGDEAGPDSKRAFLEKNSIALLSGWNAPVDAPSPGWLGSHCAHDAVRGSGLWNVNHVDMDYDERFLEMMSDHVEVMQSDRVLGESGLKP